MYTQADPPSRGNNTKYNATVAASGCRPVVRAETRSTGPARSYSAGEQHDIARRYSSIPISQLRIRWPAAPSRRSSDDFVLPCEREHGDVGLKGCAVVVVCTNEPPHWTEEPPPP